MYKNILGELLLLYIDSNKIDNTPLPLHSHTFTTKKTAVYQNYYPHLKHHAKHSKSAY